MSRTLSSPRSSFAALCALLGACASPSGGPDLRREPAPGAHTDPGARAALPTDTDPAGVESPQTWVLGAVHVDTRDIYSDEEAERSVIARLVNATHRSTHDSVVRREVWIEPGEPIRQTDAEELERNLRATGLFAEVRVRLVPRAPGAGNGDGGEGLKRDRAVDGALPLDAPPAEAPTDLAPSAEGPTGAPPPHDAPADAVPSGATPPASAMAAAAGSAVSSALGSSGGVADLRIETEDRLSISGGASGSFVGAVSSFGTSLGESNFFGTGDRIAVGYSESSDGEFRGALSYRDRHFLGTWVTATGQIGRTDEGDFGGLAFERPFKYLADDRSWRLSAATTENAVDYYESGDTVAEVPQLRESFVASYSRRYGDPHRTWTVGLLAQHERSDFDPARGPAAATIEVPGDFHATFGGVTFGHRTIFGFREVQGLDTLGYVQDLTLSAGFDALVGPTFRSQDGLDDSTQPSVALNTHFAFEATSDSYVSLAASGRGRTRSGDLAGWTVGVELTAYELSLRPHTLAAHIAYEEVFEEEGLPVQLTLGEDEDLRGYPAQQFSGERVLRMNFEDRIDLGARIGSLQFGAVVFFDVGWIEDRDEGFGAPLRSTGFGLRIGSDALLGARVVRIDLSFPLDDFGGEDFDPLVSVSLGQVFEFP